MDTVTIYGASDDLIEIEGAISAEFNYRDLDGEDTLFAFNEGTVLRVRYDREGCWRIERVVVGKAKYEHTPVDGPDADRRDDAYGTPGYSDRVTLAGTLDWVVRGSNLVRRKK